MGMGMDPAALARWEELDRKRDRAWETGLDYMEQRRELDKLYQGEELNHKLHELQDALFGTDADIIRAEEQSQFYRFNHRRRYGRE